MITQGESEHCAQILNLSNGSNVLLTESHVLLIFSLWVDFEIFAWAASANLVFSCRGIVSMHTGILNCSPLSKKLDV